MEKEKEVCALSKDRFKYYWELLLLNYNQKHTQKKFNLYYSIFKNIEEEDLKIAIKRAIENQRFFPNINEIHSCLPTQEEKMEQKLKSWENIEKEEATEEEQEELKKLLEI